MIPSLAHGPAEPVHSGIREIANEAIRRPGTIRLDVGQPDFPTPQHVKDAGKRAIDENKTFYTHTQGLISLRDKLVDKLERINGIKTTTEAIACGPGGVGAIAGQVARDAVRISLASSDADLREGVGRLAKFVHGRTSSGSFV